MGRTAIPIVVVLAAACRPARSTDVSPPKTVTSDPRAAPVVEPTPRVVARDPPRAQPPPIEIEPPTMTDRERARFEAAQSAVDQAAAAYAVDPDLINGVIWIESRFDPKARGPAGAMGLMQLMPKTGRALARRLKRTYRPYDRGFNVHAGTYYLSRMLAKFDGDEPLAIAAYNRGVGRARRYQSGEETIPERTQAFIDRVIRARMGFATARRRAAAPPEEPPP